MEKGQVINNNHFIYESIIYDKFYDDKPLVIDIFSGAGGLSYGFSERGFRILTAIDNDPQVIETFSKNIPTIKPLHETSVEKVCNKDFLKKLNLVSGKLDILIGGSPCQGFSVSNKLNRFEENPLNNLIFIFLDFVDKSLPKLFIMENVLGLKSIANGRIIKKIFSKIESMGYIYRLFEFDCSNYGIPQKRKRVFIIGIKPSEFSHELLDLNIKSCKKEVTLREAIDDLPILSNGNSIDVLEYKKKSNLTNYQILMRKKNPGNYVSNNLVSKNKDYVIERFKHIKMGENWKSIPKNLMMNYANPNNCHSSIYRRLDMNEPSITITNFRKNMIIHPKEDRLLSVREAARIQSFPDNFIFYGNLNSQQQQVANAVPPILSMKIAEELIKKFFS